MKLLDPVVLLTDRPDLGLVRGQSGTAVESFGGGIWEIEFSDDDGRTYWMGPLPEADLLVIRTTPALA